MTTFPGGHFFLHDDRVEVLRQLDRELRPILARLGNAHVA
jgi:surfactin synthase thioesterase subunit